MALKLNEEHQLTGTGLGYQHSCYVMMRALANRSGLKYGVGKHDLVALRATYQSLVFDEEDPQGQSSEKVVEFLDDEQFEDVLARVEDNVPLFGYPTPINAIDTTQIKELKQHFTFRDEITDACKKFKEDNFGDTPVISMHIRRGDFEDIGSGMFLIDDDYYEDALKQLPDGLPVLIFTNDKDYVMNNPKFIGSRFHLVHDIENNNEVVNCDWTQMMLKIVDESGMGRFYYKMVLKIMSDRTGVPVQQILKEMSAVGKRKIKYNLYNYSYDMCLMHMCDYHIMANSSFSVWGVELSNSRKVVYPKYWMQGSHVAGSIEDQIVMDLDGYDQTATIAGHFINDNWVGLDNPDQRAFTLVY